MAEKIQRGMILKLAFLGDFCLICALWLVKDFIGIGTEVAWIITAVLAGSALVSPIVLQRMFQEQDRK